MIASYTPVHMEIVEWTSTPYMAEVAWIAKMREQGCNLVNSTIGGQGTKGYMQEYPSLMKAAQFAGRVRAQHPLLLDAVQGKCVRRARKAGALCPDDAGPRLRLSSLPNDILGARAWR